MVLTASFALFPEIGLSCLRRRRNAWHWRQLDVSVETSFARFPKFVCYSRPHFHELRKAKGNRIFLIPVPLTILKFLEGIAANSVGTSKSAALVPHDFAVRFGIFVCVAQGSIASSAQRS
jgi:hypothetical protein